MAWLIAPNALKGGARSWRLTTASRLKPSILDKSWKYDSYVCISPWDDMLTRGRWEVNAIIILKSDALLFIDYLQCSMLYTFALTGRLSHTVLLADSHNSIDLVTSNIYSSSLPRLSIMMGNELLQEGFAVKSAGLASGMWRTNDLRQDRQDLMSWEIGILICVSTHHDYLWKLENTPK